MLANANTKKTQGVQTNNGDFEPIRYYFFESVDYPRVMQWKAGASRISVGVGELSPRKTDGDTVEVLPAGQGVLVVDAEFKLVRKPS